jgi:hypothetical protein
MKKQLDWLKDSVVRFEKDAKRNAEGAEDKKPKGEIRRSCRRPRPSTSR